MNKQDIIETKSRGWKDERFEPAHSERSHKKYDKPKCQKRIDQGFRAWQKSVDTSLESLDI